MSKSIKFKNNTYLDTSGIVHEKSVMNDTIDYNNKSQNGYTNLLNGLILQWGAKSISNITSTEQKVDVSYNITFPNNVLNIQTTMSDVGYGVQRFTSGVGVINPSKSGFTANVKSTSDKYGTVSFTLYWFAIGY